MSLPKNAVVVYEDPAFSRPNRRVFSETNFEGGDDVEYVALPRADFDAGEEAAEIDRANTRQLARILDLIKTDPDAPIAQTLRDLGLSEMAGKPVQMRYEGGGLWRAT